jgi:hypothetical protein
MDPEILKLIRQSVSEGLYSASWVLVVISLIAACLGAYIGSYLKSMGERRAIKETFGEFLSQLKAQTEVVEGIKGQIAERVAESTESLKGQIAERVAGSTELLKKDLAEDLEAFKVELQNASTEAVFVRELYVDGIKEFATQQAQGLRQSYLLLFEPPSSTVPDATSKSFAERLEMARQLVMAPLRNHLGILDEETIQKILFVHETLLQAPAIMEGQKQKLFQTTELARQFIPADRIAWRLGLISRPFERRPK